MYGNYEKSVFKQLETALLKIDELTDKVNRIETETKNEYMKIIYEKDEEITRLKDENTALQNKVEKFETEFKRLKAQIDKNSDNSSKPPSQNGFKKIPNSREKSNRKSGGQNGHPGYRLGLPKDLDELVRQGNAEIRVSDHTNGSKEFISRWTVDIEVNVVFTEHRYASKKDIPCAMLNEVSYGDTLKALAIFLSVEGIIPQQRLAEFFSGVSGGIINPSEATLESFLNKFAENVSEELIIIEDDLLNDSVMNTDETPMNCTQKPEYTEGSEDVHLKISEKTSFSLTLRTHSNKRSTLYTVNPHKDIAGIERDDILTRYMGTLCHDHDIKLYRYGTAHGTCGEHLSRELKGLHELQNCVWANVMRAFVLGMNKTKNADLKNGKSTCEITVLEEYEKRYDELVADGYVALSKLREKELGFKELRAMLNRLNKYKDCYMLFMRDYTVPFTNNLAERDLRPCKTKQKISGCFRSWNGAKCYAKIRSFISTVKKRKIKLFESIYNVIQGVPVLRV